MFEYAKIDCKNVLKNYEDLKMAERGIYSCAKKLIINLMSDEKGEDTLNDVCDDNLYNRYLENNSIDSDPNMWENWMLTNIKVENSKVFFDYTSDADAKYSEFLEHTNIDFLEHVIWHIKDKMEKAELTAILSGQIAAEVDREILRDLRVEK